MGLRRVHRRAGHAGRGAGESKWAAALLFIGNLPPNWKDEMGAMGEMGEDGLIYNSSQKADRRGAGGWAQTGCRSDGAETG